MVNALGILYHRIGHTGYRPDWHTGVPMPRTSDLDTYIIAGKGNSILIHNKERRSRAIHRIAVHNPQSVIVREGLDYTFRGIATGYDRLFAGDKKLIPCG